MESTRKFHYVLPNWNRDTTSLLRIEVPPRQESSSTSQERGKGLTKGRQG